jgi:hypothetical protein
MRRTVSKYPLYNRNAKSLDGEDTNNRFISQIHMGSMKPISPPRDIVNVNKRKPKRNPVNGKLLHININNDGNHDEIFVMDL